MTTPSWVTSMVNFIVSAFNTFVSGIGNGVTTFFQQIFLTNTGTTENPVYELSTFASVSLVMLGKKKCSTKSRLIAGKSH